MFLKKTLLPLALFVAYFSYSQNLVRNSSFEEVSEKAKDSLAIEASVGWVSTTGQGVNLYNSGSKKATNFLLSDQDKTSAFEGDKFASIKAFSYFAQEPRTYLTNLMVAEVKEKSFYCLKLKVKLHPRAKYHSDDLAVIVTSYDIGLNADVLLIEEKATKLSFPEQFTAGEWVEVYAGFEAPEDGEFLNIGNFTSDAVTTHIELEKTKESVFKGQIPFAFYFIDDLQLTQISKIADCPAFVPDIDALASNSNKDKAPPKRNVIKKDDFSRLPPLPERKKPEANPNAEPEMVGDENLAKAIRDENTIVFLNYSSGLDDKLYNEIDRMLNKFQKGDHRQLTLIARTSYDEAYAASFNLSLRSLSEKRLRYVKEYLTRKGLDEGLIQTVNEPYDAAKLQGGSPTVSFMFN